MAQLYELEAADYDLIQHAYQALTKAHVPEKRFIVAAARAEHGIIFTALNIRAYLGKASVCAEPSVLGEVLDAGFGCPTTLVVVCYPESIVTPCGACRELLCDYCPSMDVIIPTPEGLKKCNIKDLLPYKFFGVSKNAFSR